MGQRRLRNIKLRFNPLALSGKTARLRELCAQDLHSLFEIENVVV